MYNKATCVRVSALFGNSCLLLQQQQHHCFIFRRRWEPTVMYSHSA